MQSLIKKAVKIITLIICLSFVVFCLLADVIAKNLTEYIFSQGTNRRVVVEEAKLNFFPPQILAKKVFFDADKKRDLIISDLLLTFEIHRINTKEVRFGLLKLDGVKIDAISAENSFMALLDFILPKREVEPKFKFRINKIQISTLKGDSEGFTYKYKKLPVLKWKDLILEIEPQEERGSYLYAKSNGLIIKTDSKKLTYKDFKGQFAIKKGDIFIERINLIGKDSSVKANSRINDTVFAKVLLSYQDSVINFEISGNKLPLALDGKINGILKASKFKEASLKGDLSYKDNKLLLKVEEERSYSAISPEQSFVDDKDIGGQTNFKYEQDSNLFFKLDYDFSKKGLFRAKFKSNRYPISNLGIYTFPFSNLSFAQFGKEATIKTDLDIEVDNLNVLTQGSFEVLDLKAVGASFNSVKGDVKAEKGMIYLSNLEAKSSKDLIKGDAQFHLGQKEYLLQVYTENSKLSFLDNVRENTENIFSKNGGVSGQVSISKNKDNLAIDGILDLSTKNLKKISGSKYQDSQIRIKTEKGRVKAEIEAFDRALIALLELSQKEEKLSINSNIKHLELSQLNLFRNELVGESVGDLLVDLDLNYQTSLDDLLAGSGEIFISHLSREEEDLFFNKKNPLNLKIKDKNVLFSFLGSAETNIKLKGELGANNELRLNLLGEENIEKFQGFLPKSIQPSGNLKCDLNLRLALYEGQYRVSNLSGAVKLLNSNLMLDFPKFNESISDLNLELLFEQNKIKLSKFNGKILDGEIKGGGSISFQNGKPIYNISSEITPFTYTLNNELSFILAGDVKVVSQESNLHKIFADIKVDSGIYESKIELDKILKLIREFLFGRENILLKDSKIENIETQVERKEGNFQLEILLKTLGPIDIKTDFISGELFGNIQITGDFKNKKYLGKLNLEKGVLGLEGSKFKVIDSKVIFEPNEEVNNPRIKLFAESSIVDEIGQIHQIRLTINGTLKNPKIVFSSDTGLREEDIVKLLASGGSGQFTIIKKDEPAPSVWDFFDPTSGASLKDRLYGLAGFSEVKVDPKILLGEGTVAPELIVTKPLFSELEVKLQSSLFQSQVSQAQVTYSLTPYLDLIAKWISNSYINQANQSSGALEVGIYYKKPFPYLRRR